MIGMELTPGDNRVDSFKSRKMWKNYKNIYLYIMQFTKAESSI